MARATWNGAVIAEGDEALQLEGNVYFARGALKHGYFEESDHRTVCPWKGVAHYLHIVVDGERNEKAAWYYPKPSFLARKIRDRVAFWNGVRVEDASSAASGVGC